MFSFDNILKFNNKEIDVFTIGELLVDMISNDYDPFYKFAVPASNNQVIEAWKSFYSVIAQSNMVI